MNTIDLFKVVVAKRTGMNYTHALDGFITDFTPTPSQLKVLKEKCQALPVTTLFTVEERTQSDPATLIEKQILHYIEVYGLDSPGLFQLEQTNGRIATLSFIKAVTTEELSTLVHDLIYANRPIADVKPVIEVMQEYGIKYDINAVRNNELKVALFDPKRDDFNDGDDAVRWLCYQATDSSLLIKSEKVIAAVKEWNATKGGAGWFLARHRLPLAQVFNRHKRIIMACKNSDTAPIINQISRMSKKNHVPIHEPISKRFISASLKGTAPSNVLDTITLRDKLKYLNLIEYKLLGLPYDSFNIRNGKVWFEGKRTLLDKDDLLGIGEEILVSLHIDLAALRRSTILLDPNVDYGLPISRKQAMGNLPFGTRVRGTEIKKLSAGIYWHNDFGKDNLEWQSFYTKSIDLDLSAIDDKGYHTGWGSYSGYSKDNPVVFSGDVTDATHGASEFMTVDIDNPNRCGLMVNIYRGPEPCPAEIVVGVPNGKVWQEQTYIRERITLQKGQNLIGLLKDDSFIIYSGKLNNNRVSKDRHPVMDKGLGRLWTLKMLLDALVIHYDTEPQAGRTYDHDLRYHNFSLDKLEKLLGV